MALKRWKIIDKNGETVKTIQAKRRDMAEKCVAEYIRIGSLPSGEYSVELIAKEGK